MHPVKKRGGGFNLIWIDCLTSFTVIHTYIHINFYVIFKKTITYVLSLSGKYFLCDELAQSMIPTQ